jgi:hypothetical protein
MVKTSEILCTDRTIVVGAFSWFGGFCPMIFWYTWCVEPCMAFALDDTMDCYDGDDTSVWLDSSSDAADRSDMGIIFFAEASSMVAKYTCARLVWSDWWWMIGLVVRRYVAVRTRW